MIPANRIPDLTKMTPATAEVWWQQMGEMGLIFHPDDPPADIVHIQSGEKLFSAKASAKLETIIGRMLRSLGDRTYDIAHRELMRCLGWEENLEGDGWERMTRL